MNGHQFTRRFFFGTVAAAASGAYLSSFGARAATAFSLNGPGTKYKPRIKAAFVRRKGDYGLRWPGAIYDGEAAKANYSKLITAAAQDLNVDVDILPTPLYSLEEGEQWVVQVKAAKPDGIVLALLDRQEHTWPVAEKVANANIPAVIFAPLGTAFTINTAPLAEKEGVLIASTDDFRQVAMAMKMIRAGAKLREARFVIIKGKDRKEVSVKHFGTKLQYVPADSFLEKYEKTAISPEIEAIADEYINNAQKISGPSRQDVINGVKSFVVAREFLKDEQADGISMDCLGALGKTKVSLPCIAWSRMLDSGIPAACEADLGACITHALVLYLFDRPGFEQDPVPDTAAQCLIGAHCTCPTRLRGCTENPEPYFLSYHHGKRDAVPVPHWAEGQRVTIADVALVEEGLTAPEMIISTGAVAKNMAVPPSGGCVVSVGVKLDRETNLLKHPGFHQIFFYGDYQQELVDFCKLCRVKPVVV